MSIIGRSLGFFILTRMISLWHSLSWFLIVSSCSLVCGTIYFSEPTSIKEIYHSTSSSLWRPYDEIICLSLKSLIASVSIWMYDTTSYGILFSFFFHAIVTYPLIFYSIQNYSISLIIIPSSSFVVFKMSSHVLSTIPTPIISNF